MASPSSSSTSSSPIHPASLVDRTHHSPALLDLVAIKVSQEVYNYTIDRVIETVDFAMRRSTPSSSRGRAFNKRKPEHVKFAGFVKDVLSRAEVTMPTLLAALVYVDRARPQLHIGLEQWALERVFLGALIVASKYLNDSTLKNVHWAMCTGVFGKRDVGRIEREYLDVLGFELKITEQDLLKHEQGILSAISESSPISFPTKSLPSAPEPAAVSVTVAPTTTTTSTTTSPKRERETHHELVYPTPPPSSSSLHYVVHTHSERRHKRRRLPAPVSPASSSSPLFPPSYSSSRSSSQSPPELSTSTDSDSDEEESPRTPELGMGMEIDPSSPTKQAKQSSHRFTPRKMMHGFSTMDILRSFPLPRINSSSS